MVLSRAKQVGRQGSVETGVLLSVMVIVAAVCGFLALAYAVSRTMTQSFDERLLRSLRDPADADRPLGPKWLEEAARDLTAVGGVAELCLLTAAVSGYLLICKKYRALVLLLVATLGGLLLSTLLKEHFDRPRPHVVPYLSYAVTSSFPSGHSLNSAVVYLTLGSLLASLVQQRRLKFYFFSVALLLTFLVGVSRVFMGVHWPTDVLAGWCAGLAWALACSLVARRLRQRGDVEAVDR
jgi:undecaprenyl-diphosphatase